MTIYGTRPEAIKMAPLITALSETPALESVVAVTGQHREMLDQVNRLFQIVPRYDLDIMVAGASLADITCRTLQAANTLIREEAPDVVIVQGDTNSAFAAALAGFYQGTAVVHLEAGLRTGHPRNPFPEEANRRLIAPLTTLHLAPTQRSRTNLEAEGIASKDICVTGNTVIDALMAAIGTAVRFQSHDLEQLIHNSAPFILITTHRRESWGAPMFRAMTALRRVATENPAIHLVVPMHRNPKVRETIESVLTGVTNVHLIEPLSYHEFCHAMQACLMIVTDSGGVQEEAPSLGKPVLVMRETTERPEGVDGGNVRLVGTDPEEIYRSASDLIHNTELYESMANKHNPFGDGHAAQRSVAAIMHMLGIGPRPLDFSPARGDQDFA